MNKLQTDFSIKSPRIWQRRQKFYLLIRIGLCCVFWFNISLFSADARVFWRKDSKGTAVFNNTPGWRTVYQSVVSINDRPGNMYVVLCDNSIPEVQAELSSAWEMTSDDLKAWSGGESDYRVVRKAGKVYRFLFSGLPASNQTIMLGLEQTAGDYEASLKPPVSRGLLVIPEYPGSKPELLAENKDTRLSLQVSSTSDRAETVLDFYRSELLSAGYQPLLPQSTFISQTDLLLYAKGGMFCCVLVRDKNSLGRCLITALHKRLHIE